MQTKLLLLRLLAPIWVECGVICLVEVKCKDLGKFFDAERADRNREALEETLCIFSFLLIDSKQRLRIGFI